MKNVLLILFFGLSFLSVRAQITKPDRTNINRTSNNMYQSDSTKFSKERKVTVEGKTHYKDYKVISIKNDTTFIDTVLNIQKQYKFNYIRKDNFELMAFSNQGQTFNKLGYNFSESAVFPEMGFMDRRTEHWALRTVKIQKLEQ